MKEKEQDAKIIYNGSTSAIATVGAQAFPAVTGWAWVNPSKNKPDKDCRIV